MRVKTTEKIIMSWKENEIWGDFDRLIDEIHTEINDDEIFELVNELQKIMSNLEEYIEVE